MLAYLYTKQVTLNTAKNDSILSASSSNMFHWGEGDRVGRSFKVTPTKN